MDRHSDPLDKAADFAQMYNDHGLDAVRRKVQPEQVQNEDGTWPHELCIDCEDEIPANRLSLGKVRCLSCQEIKEKRQRGYK